MHRYEITDVKGGTAFLVQVTPEAETSQITGKDEDVVYVQLATPREMEAVNEALRSLLVEKLMIDKLDVSVASGSSIEKKIIIIMGLAPEEIERRLLAESS